MHVIKFRKEKYHVDKKRIQSSLGEEAREGSYEEVIFMKRQKAGAGSQEGQLRKAVLRKQEQHMHKGPEAGENVLFTRKPDRITIMMLVSRVAMSWGLWGPD